MKGMHKKKNEFKYSLEYKLQQKANQISLWSQGSDPYAYSEFSETG